MKTQWICKENRSMTFTQGSAIRRTFVSGWVNADIVRNDRDNLIVTLTTKFALHIIELAEHLDQERKFIIARQLLRSGTSIGANVREAQNAESKADFVHKFKIAAKESDETFYWLTLCKEAASYPNPNPELFDQLRDISRIIAKIIATSKRG